MTRLCKVEGCGRTVKREGFELCYSCWQTRDQLVKTGDVYALAEHPKQGVDKASSGEQVSGGVTMSATKLGKALVLSNRRVNLVLAELGWIEKFTKGWKATAQGEKAGGETKTGKSGIPYVVWPDAIMHNKVFRAVVAEIGGGAATSDASVEVPGVSTGPHVEDGRKRYPAKYRAADGHYVRSRAELSIDNWLYMQGIVHAYERKLPLEEDAYCDFYLPSSKVFVEYWGMEKEPAYAARMADKQALYAKYGLNLVELGDAELENLDDNLPRLLIKYGVNCV